ncbi:MAG: Ig-like domain-containing protein [Verrucomicrobiales bacterium]|nr:Ig-like domain-containing protein [Verrucomicrobiales bacterium]
MKNCISATIVAIFLGLAPSDFAATATVQAGSGGNIFTPATTNINVGDRVIWVWSGLNHSSTSDTAGLWDSGVFNAPHSFTNQFNASGTFPYHCTIHVSFGMTGSIIVAAPNSPPSVTITNPASGTVLAAPANVTIQASATDDGTVTNVQFLVGSTVLTNKAAAPFFAVTNNLAAGNYTLSAIASDNLGAKATNAVNISVVTPLALVISAPQLLAASFQFNYSANTGLTYIVQRSTNLAVPDWISMVTNTAASNPVVFVDSQATNSPGFYRVGRLPNP